MATNTNQAAAESKGGTVEPANRAAVPKERFQTPLDDMRGERFELRDPFVDVTYRSNVFAEIAAKAKELGSDRFTAVAEDGRRSVVKNVGGEWQRGPQLPATKERPLDATPDQEGSPARPAAEVPGKSAARQPVEPPTPDATSKIDAAAERAAMLVRLEDALKDRYIIKRAPVTVGSMTVGQTEYRFRADTSRIAFTESTFRLATDTNSPSVARSMVDVAQARNWKGLRVSGAEDFRRLVWLEASVRGVKAVGYEPNPGDLDVLKRERDARQVNRIELTQDGSPSAKETGTAKTSARGGGRKAVLAAIEAVLVSKNVPEAKRAAVLAAATDKLAQRGQGHSAPRVKVYDLAGRTERPAPLIAPATTPARERAAPAHTR